MNLLNNAMTYQTDKKESTKSQQPISKISLTFDLFLLFLFGLHKEGSFLQSLQEVFLLEDITFPAMYQLHSSSYFKGQKRATRTKMSTDY